MNGCQRITRHLKLRTAICNTHFMWQAYFCSPMEPAKSRAIEMLRAQLRVLEIEEKRIRVILADPATSAGARIQALADYETLLKARKIQVEELASIEASSE